MGSQGKSSFVLLSSLSCGLAFQLAYSYIQCTDTSWPASYDDADAGLDYVVLLVLFY
ncbi:hypothetical protein MTR67_023959 [Solanum verrucosum]|uniref:Uncharacterized protein n=1 Tax=Solanum verrucosum TaxID=315347 RepID=A0AAF0R2X4_SOLVR|nr:hypothetical protein MTR67_023959 [Solanum verrucosum]